MVILLAEDTVSIQVLVVVVEYAVTVKPMFSARNKLPYSRTYPRGKSVQLRFRFTDISNVCGVLLVFCTVHVMISINSDVVISEH